MKDIAGPNIISEPLRTALRQIKDRVRFLHLRRQKVNARDRPDASDTNIIVS